MSLQVILGRRANGDNGIFGAPPGVDAFTAPDAQLTLNISSKVPQLILLGAVPSSQYVPLAAGRPPYVFITNRMSMVGTPGYGDLDGPIRPAPNGIYGTAGICSADIAGDGSVMFVTVAAGARASYAVYNIPF